jgi:hypothetical protein
MTTRYVVLVYLLLVMTSVLICPRAIAQNRILVVTDSSSGILQPDTLLDRILNATTYRFEFMDYVPDPLDTRDFSSIVLASRSAAIACQVQNLDRFIRDGGGLICGGGIPLYLYPSDSVNPIVDWFNCSRYENGSGEAYAYCTDMAFSIYDNQLLDRTACGIGFGGFSGPGEDVQILAHWFCGENREAIFALTNRVGSGRVFYMSRLVQSEPLRRMFAASLSATLEYVWGDANGSRFVDIDDIVFLVDYIFDQGEPPEVWNAADPSGDGQVDIDDVVNLVGWVFERKGYPKAGNIDR